MVENHDYPIISHIKPYHSPEYPMMISELSQNQSIITWMLKGTLWIPPMLDVPFGKPTNHFQQIH